MAQANGDVASWIGAHVPAANQAMATGYLTTFNNTWDPSTPTGPATARATTNGTIAGPGHLAQSFVNGLSAPADQKQMILGVAQAFTIPLYIDPSQKKGTIESLIIGSSNGALTSADLPRLDAMYGLGPAPSGAAIDALTLSFVTAGLSLSDAQNANDLYALGNNRDRIWDYVLSNALAGQTNVTVQELIRDAWALGRSATNEDFDKYVLGRAGRGMNASEQAQLRTIYSWGPSPNGSVISGYVLNKSAGGHE
jgi:putative drug exporter of the RND superfamily